MQELFFDSLIISSNIIPIKLLLLLRDNALAEIPKKFFPTFRDILIVFPFDITSLSKLSINFLNISFLSSFKRSVLFKRKIPLSYSLEVSPKKLNNRK